MLLINLLRKGFFSLPWSFILSCWNLAESSKLCLSFSPTQTHFFILEMTPRNTVQKLLGKLEEEDLLLELQGTQWTLAEAQAI